MFDQAQPQEITHFFNDLEVLFSWAQIISDTEKKKLVVYYTDFKTEQIWKSFTEFTSATASYQNFKDAILEYYPDVSGDYVYSMRDVDMLIEKGNISALTWLTTWRILTSISSQSPHG